MSPIDDGVDDGSRYAAGLTRLTVIWVLVALVLFPILAVLGLLMRVLQAGFFASLPPEWFYAVMTLHGLGMVGLWFVAGMAGVSFLLARYVRPTLAVSWVAFAATLIGVALLFTATLAGRLGVGWYFLYPLPFHSGGTWPPWATASLFVALAIMGVGWTLWAGDLLWAIARKYSLSNALGWHYLGGSGTPEVPPLIIISTVSVIGVIAGLVAAVVILVLVAAEQFTIGFINDALLIKNLTFYFGHMLVNITMYLGVAMVYEIMPAYTGRPWKTNMLVAASWNLVLLLVTFAYLHHLYMDFAQPQWLQVAGQLSSYLISVPAAVVTIFSTLALVYGANAQWKLPSILLYLGVMGWAIGGVAAVIDSTVMVNSRFHNTLWVPAHFHTYYVMGVVLMILGVVFHLAADLSKLPESRTLTRAIVGTVGVGGYGFLLMFYLAGVAGVPRRYATYPDEIVRGILYAKVSLLFIALLLLGALLYIWEAGRRCVRVFSALAGRGAIALLLTLCAAAAAAQTDRRSTPPEEDRVINVEVPDVLLTTATGVRVGLSAVGRGQPLLVTLVFTRCAGVCSPFLRSWRAADRSVSRSSTFHRLVLSFDPRDSAADMAMLAHHLDVERDANWTFAVAAPADVRRFAAAAGFWYDWDEERQQYDHPAMLAGIRDRRLVRLLVGGTVSSGRLDELVRDVSGEFVASYPLPGRVRFRCVQYVDATGRVALDWGFALLLIPVGVTGLTTAGMFVIGARIRRVPRGQGRPRLGRDQLAGRITFP